MDSTMTLCELGTMPMLEGRVRRRIVLATVGWMISSAVIVIVVGRLNAFPYLRLVRGGSTTLGRVIAREPRNHDSVVVRYSVAGEEHVIRRSFVGKPNPPKNTLTVGNTVTIYYLPQAPTTATIGDPRDLLPNELTAVGMAATIVPTLLVGGVFWRTRRPRERRQ
jgi:hypothetical protein